MKSGIISTHSVGKMQLRWEYLRTSQSVVLLNQHFDLVLWTAIIILPSRDYLFSVGFHHAAVVQDSLFALDR